MNFVKNPNFPSRNITVAAVSSEADDVISALQSAKIAVVPVEPNENLPTGIASHADLQILHLGGNSLLTSRCSKNSTDMLNMLGFEIQNTENDKNDSEHGRDHQKQSSDHIFGHSVTIPFPCFYRRDAVLPVSDPLLPIH